MTLFLPTCRAEPFLNRDEAVQERLLIAVAIAVGAVCITAGNAGAAPVACDGVRVTIRGTDGADRINGTGHRDVIDGLGGNDVIDGLGGNDLICGGGGNDRLFGGDGNDKLLGQGGNDALRGEKGTDTLLGATGNDLLDVGPGDVDSVQFNLGRDYRRLVTTVGWEDNETDSDATALFEVYGDGPDPLWSQPLSFGQSRTITLDVTNVLRLTFRVEPQGTVSWSGLPVYGSPYVSANRFMVPERPVN
jgi:hypothetical protein